MTRFDNPLLHNMQKKSPFFGFFLRRIHYRLESQFHPNSSLISFNIAVPAEKKTNRMAGFAFVALVTFFHKQIGESITALQTTTNTFLWLKTISIFNSFFKSRIWVKSDSFVQLLQPFRTVNKYFFITTQLREKQHALKTKIKS